MKKAFLAIEVMLAAGIFTILASAIVTLVAQGFNMGRLAREELQAGEFASEGIEGAKSIKNFSFENLAASSSSDVIVSGTGWTLSPGTNTFEKFTRTVKVYQVYRDGSGNIVASGGTVDPDTKKVESEVAWNFSPLRQNSVKYTAYLTNWIKSKRGNWANPSIQSTVNLSSNTDAWDVTTLGSYVYVTKNTNNQSLSTVNIANLSAPSVVATLNLTGNIWGISHNTYNNFKAVASTDDTKEMQLINLISPSSPSVAGVFNATGTADATSVEISGNFAYLVRVNKADPEFYSINISNPASPTQAGNLNLSGDIVDIEIVGNLAVVGSTDDSTELQLINITDPASPSLSGTINLSGIANATTVTAFKDTAIVGRDDGTINIVDISNPASPQNITTISSGSARVDGLSVSDDNSLLFVSVNSPASGFQVYDISNISSPLKISSLNLTSASNRLYYDNSLDRVFLASQDNNTELIIIKPQ